MLSRPKPKNFAHPRSLPAGTLLALASCDREVLDLFYQHEGSPAPVAYSALDLPSGKPLADYPCGLYE